VTDRGIVEKKLSEIEGFVQELRTFTRLEILRDDIVQERFVKHTLLMAAQAALDVANHIVSDERLGEPRANKDLFDLLKRYGWISAELAAALREMAGFRNILVHVYGDVDLGMVEKILRHHLDDLLAFVAAIRARMTDPV
jgi:uncharacterized protein YutE (UPF0331/DUF86 family)